MSTVPIQNLRSGVASKRPVATGLSVGEIAINYNEADPAIYLRGNADALVKVAPVYVATGAPNATPASGGASGNSIGEQWLDKSVTPPIQKVWDGSTWVPSFAIGSGAITNSEINASAAIALSKLATGALPSAITVDSSNIVNDTIVNADISSSAAIALSKLATGALPSGITVETSNIVNGTIVDDDINASAAIGLSKLATGALPSGITIASSNIVDGTIVDGDINASAAISLSKLATGALPSGITIASSNITDGTIVDADINATAAITLTKLANGALPSGITVNSANIVNDSIINADISPTAAISYSKLSLSNSIVNADISASAAIADSKLATISTAGKVNGGAITTGTIGGSTAISTSGIIATSSQIRAVASGNGNYVGFTAPDTVASNVLFTLPSGDGTSGQFLSTNGSGSLAWSSVSAGSTISEGNTSVSVSDTGGSENASVVINGSQILRAASSGVVVSGVVSSSSTVSDTSGNLRVAPPNTQSSAYTLVATDTGKHISISTGGVTIPANIFSVGSIVTIFNNSASNQTITQGASTTLRVPGTATTGNRTLAQYGVATILCVDTNVFVISGTGVS